MARPKTGDDATGNTKTGLLKRGKVHDTPPLSKALAPRARAVPLAA
jgi:hypothetical protein